MVPPDGEVAEDGPGLSAAVLPLLMPPSESDFPVRGVPVQGGGAEDSAVDHVAAALGIVVGLLHVIEQADRELPPPMPTITHGLAMVQASLERAVAGAPPYIRRPGDPVGHGAVTA